MGLLGCMRRRKQSANSSSNITNGRLSKGKSLEDKYELLQQLGEGKTGQVFLARHLRSRAEVAVKIVRTAYLDTPARQEAFRSEIAILRLVKHPAVLKVFDVFQDEDKFAIVSEKASGGELMDAICATGDGKNRRPLRESDVVAIVRELLGVLAHLHTRGITHRDLKMENILVKSSDRNLDDGILLIDFGLAYKGKVGMAEMTGMNGTCHYMAPEMFGRESRYGSEIDVWALGVVTFVLLFGRFPFDAKFLSQVEDKIIACNFTFPEDLAPLVSHEAKKFIEYLLVVNPRERPPAAMALHHPWLRADSRSSGSEFSEYHMSQLRKFVEDKKVSQQSS